MILYHKTINQSIDLEKVL